MKRNRSDRLSRTRKADQPRPPMKSTAFSSYELVAAIVVGLLVAVVLSLVVSNKIALVEQDKNKQILGSVNRDSGNIAYVQFNNGLRQ